MFEIHGSRVREERLQYELSSKTDCHEKQIVTKNRLSSKINCHPERSEGSWFLLAVRISMAQASTDIPRLARDDKTGLAKQKRETRSPE
jgi:hypothetical protein